MAQSRRPPAGVAGPVAPATAQATATLTITHHPFWDVTTHTWTRAASLHSGDTLQTPTGHAQVVAQRRRERCVSYGNLSRDAFLI
jgi:hypothetical protein